jgi:hypothetical protein
MLASFLHTLTEKNMLLVCKPDEPQESDNCKKMKDFETLRFEILMPTSLAVIPSLVKNVTIADKSSASACKDITLKYN